MRARTLARTALAVSTLPTAWSSIVSAATLHVPGEYPTIQAALAATSPGDSVLVAPGTYHGNVIMPSDVALVSEAGSSATTIDVSLGGSVITCRNITGAIIQGFTLTGGTGSVYDIYRAGGGILCAGSSPTIRDVAIIGCVIHPESWEYTLAGGGIACLWGSAPLIENCVIRDNMLEHGVPNTLGAGIFCDASSPAVIRGTTLSGQYSLNGGAGGVDSRTPDLVLEDCVLEHNYGDDAGGFMGVGTVRRCRFESNYGGGVLSAGGIRTSGDMEIVDCLLVENGSWVGAGYYGGVEIEFGAVTLRGNTIVRNYAVMGAGVGRLANEPMVMERNIIAENGNGESGYGVVGWRDGVDRLRCNDVWRNRGGDYYPVDPGGVEGNFSADPLFCDPEAGDYRLDTASPCLPGHHPHGDDCGLIGALGQGCGATAVQTGSWGSVKQLFR